MNYVKIVTFSSAQFWDKKYQVLCSLNQLFYQNEQDTIALLGISKEKAPEPHFIGKVSNTVTINQACHK